MIFQTLEILQFGFQNLQFFNPNFRLKKSYLDMHLYFHKHIQRK